MSNKAKVRIEIEYNGQYFWDEVNVVPDLLVDGVMDLMGGLEVEVREEEKKRLEVKKLLKE